MKIFECIISLDVRVDFIFTMTRKLSFIGFIMQDIKYIDGTELKCLAISHI